MSEPTKPRFILSKRAVTSSRMLELLSVIGIIAVMVLTDTPWLGLIVVALLITDKLLDRHVWKIKTWQRAQWQWNESVIQSILLDASSVSRVEKNLQLPPHFNVRLLNGYNLSITDQLWARLGPGLVVKYEVRELNEKREYRNISPA